MDHLTTSEERKDRWYASHLSPIYANTEPAQKWEDLWETFSSETTRTTSRVLVRSLPFDWIRTKAGVDFTSSEKLSKGVRRALDTNGFLVVSGVLCRADCDTALEHAWDWLESASEAERFVRRNSNGDKQRDNDSMSSDGTRSALTTTTTCPVHRRDLATLASPYFPRSVEGGMMPFYGSGHSQFAWTIRSHPNVQKVFEVFHNTDNLISSLDGILLWRGGGSDRNKYCTDTGWFHLDQNPRFKPNQECIQGLVNLLPTGPSTGGNVVVAKSHLLFPHHYLSSASHNIDNNSSLFYNQRLDELGDEDWMEIDKHDTDLLSPSNILSCLLEPGDMMLWDSRTVHCSYPAAQEESNSPTTNLRLIRAAVTVSMMPVGGIKDEVLRSRKQAVDQSRTLTHWVNKAAPLGEEHSEDVLQEKVCVNFMKRRQKSLGVPKVLLEFDDLNSHQQRLVMGGSQ